MSGRILRGPENAEHIYPDVSYGKILFDRLLQTPDTVAMIDALSHEQITYRDLLDQSIKAAIGLQKLGIKKNDVIVIVNQNCLNYSIPVLAGFYIGATVNPLNPDYTTRELKHAFDISKPKVVFVSELNIKSVLTIKQEVDYIEKIIVFGNGTDGAIDLKELLILGNDGVNEFVPCKVDTKEDVALILCSSGTTGLPKAVMLTHTNITQACINLVDSKYGSCNKNASTIGLMPFFHTFGMFLNLAALLTEMQIVLLAKFKPDAFLSIIQDYKITKLFIAPPLAVFMAKSPLVDNYNLSSVNDVICAAAPLGSEVQHILEHKLNVTIRQAYGMTELGGCLTISILGSPSQVGSSGNLVYGTTAKITDLETNATLGVNEIGEICTKSDMVMKGYLNNKKATTAMFDEDGFLHTGDIGYFNEDGCLYIVDRLKELIKYKGFQVAPAELEDLLTSHEDVVDAGVIGIPDERAGETPIAFVVKKSGAKVTEKEIIDYIADNVSIQKQLHGGVKFIDAIPKSATGKILRKDLRKMLNC